MVAAARLKIRDTGELTRVLASLRQTEKAQVKVGVLGSSDSEIAYRATVNEFGAPEAGIPERSFLRKTFDTKQNELRSVQRSALEKIVAGKLTVEGGLKLIGEWFASEVKKTITETVSPPNAPSTIAAKGSSHPLIDTGAMRQAISYEVDLNGGKNTGLSVVSEGGGG